MFDLFRDDVRVGLRDIAERPARDPEEIGAWDRKWGRRPAAAVITLTGQVAGQGTDRRLRKIRETVIRHALLALIDVVQRGLGALLEVVDHGRRDTPALGPDLVAGRGVDVLEESLDAAGHVAALAAGVDHLAVAVAGHHRRGRLEVVRAGRQSGDVVDGAAGGASSERERRRALVDLDPVDRERVAGIPAGIADAVTEQVAARDEAADDRTVALLAAFAGAEGDAGDVLQGLLDGGGVLLLDDRLRDDVDGLRHVEDRHRQPRDAGIGDLIRGRSERRVGAARSRLVRRYRLGRRRGSGHRARGRRRPHRSRRTRPAGLDRNRGQCVGLLLGLRRGGAGGRLLRGRALRRRAESAPARWCSDRQRRVPPRSPSRR